MNPNGGRSASLIVLIGLAAVILCGIGVYMYSKATPTVQPPSSTSAPTASPSPAEMFTGTWKMGNDTDGFFWVKLVQTGATITGSHCYSSANAAELDCDSGDEGNGKSITGTVRGNVATLSALSFRDADPQPQSATFTVTETTGTWKLTGITSTDSDSLIPDTATLTLEN